MKTTNHFKSNAHFELYTLSKGYLILFTWTVTGESTVKAKSKIARPVGSHKSIHIRACKAIFYMSALCSLCLRIKTKWQAKISPSLIISRNFWQEKAIIFSTSYCDYIKYCKAADIDCYCNFYFICYRSQEV